MLKVNTLGRMKIATPVELWSLMTRREGCKQTHASRTQTRRHRLPPDRRRKPDRNQDVVTVIRSGPATHTARTVACVCPWHTVYVCSVVCVVRPWCRADEAVATAGQSAPGKEHEPCHAWASRTFSCSTFTPPTPSLLPHHTTLHDRTLHTTPHPAFRARPRQETTQQPRHRLPLPSATPSSHLAPRLDLPPLLWPARHSSADCAPSCRLCSVYKLLTRMGKRQHLEQHMA